jgi:hypothetical protein
MKTFLAALLFTLFAVPIGTASGQTDAPRLYVLKTGSSLATGCFGPCLCPVLEQPMQGTFTLKRTSVDPLFTSYEVLDVRWTLPDATQSVPIVGSGTYRVGGEVAVQQQMVLDLSVGGGAKQHFDSGLVLGGGTFPVIDIKLSLHGQQACIDTVLHVIAAPATATSAEDAGSSMRPGIRTATPSPFQDQVGFVLTMPRAGRVGVAIYDARGRRVRDLFEGEWGAGEHPIVWDGKANRGADCGAGLYLARATIGGEHFVARVIRVR